MSPLLFTLCLNRIVDRLNGVWKEEVWNVLLYADDALVFGKSEGEITQKLNVYRTECREMGLEVNEGKSEMMVIGKQGVKKERIAGFEVKKEIKYLGVWIDEKGSFKKTVKERIKRSETMRKFVSYVISGRKRKMELGKVIWKGAVVPTLIHGLAAMGLEKTGMDRMEVEQRKFGRGLLEVSGSVPKEFVERELGVSCQKERVDRVRIRMAKRILERGGKMREEIVKNWNSGFAWIKELRNNIRWIGIQEEEFEEMELKEINKAMRVARNRDWEEGMRGKRSLRWYGMICEKGLNGRSWRSEEVDRVTKRYWSGMMEHRIRVEEVCDCGETEGMESVEHFLRRCYRTKEWRKDWNVREDEEMVEILTERGEGLMDLERRRRVV